MKSKIIPTPEALWDLFVLYKDAIKGTFRYQHALNQRNGTVIKIPLEVPLTKEGFYNYCANEVEITTLKDYFSNRDERYTDYVPICMRIRDEIRQDQIEGGMVGQYNHSLTARINGLSEKTELTGPDGGPLQMQQITGMDVL